MSDVAYCTKEEIQASMPELSDTEWGTKYDDIMDELAKRASRAIDLYTKQIPGAYLVTVDTERIYDGSGNSIQTINEIAAAPTKVEVAETGDITNYTEWASTNYWMVPYNALAEGRPYTQIELDVQYGTKKSFYKFKRAVKVTGKFGFSTTVPHMIKEVTIIQASRWFKRGQQAWEDAGAVPGLSSLKYVQTLDPDVQKALEFLREPTI
jgi:hypothetical protein